MAQKMRGQVVIWVFVALGLTAIFVLLMTLRPAPTRTDISTSDPVMYIQGCVRDALRDELDVHLPTGGITGGKRIMFDNRSYVALCYNSKLFEPCVSQFPLPLETFTKQLYERTLPIVGSCFASLQHALEQQGTVASMQALTYSLSFAPGTLFVTITRSLSLSDRGTTRDYETFDFTLTTATYELLDLAREIASQEGQFCYFEYAGYMILYPEYTITKTALADTSKLYTLTHLPTQTSLGFVTRGCALPAGV
jgi:hypothetical protein